MNTENIVDAIRNGRFSTRELVLVSSAVASCGTNTTSVLGQYGEEIVAAAYDGQIGSFDQKGYDVLTATGERLQVKAYTIGNRAARIHSFEYDVVTVGVDPATATVALGKRYAAADLYQAFRNLWESKYRHMNDNFATWGGTPHHRFERGWHIVAGAPFIDVTPLLAAAAERLSHGDSTTAVHPT